MAHACRSRSSPANPWDGWHWHSVGDLGEDTHLVGIDLDSCIGEPGKITDWAQNILDLLCSYAETSPSGTGIKLFLQIRSGDVRPLLQDIGVPDHQYGCKRTIDAGGQKHGPAIELYVSHRYFTVTDQRLAGHPEQIALVDRETLSRLAGLIPRQKSLAASRTTRTVAKTTTPPPADTSVDTIQLSKKLADALRRSAKLRRRYEGGTEGLADTSRSGRDMSLGAMLSAAGFSYPEMRSMLIEWQYGAGHEHAADDRYFHRIWERTAAHQRPVPTIQLRSGLRHEAATEALAALMATGVPLYRLDRSLVYVSRVPAKAADGAIVNIPAVTPVPLPLLGRTLGQAARWERLKSNGEIIRVDPPRDVLEQILVMSDEWPFPPLYGVITTPTMRPDGSLLLKPGYDPATGLVLFDPPAMPIIPERPSKWDALDALTLLNSLLSEFPFANDVSRSAAMSMLMTPVLRAGMMVAPIHIVRAPEAGTGKSYLQDIAATIASGERCPVMAVSDNPEETEKRLVGAALAQRPIIALDNCNRLLMGDFLCQAAERPLLQLRPLGTSQLIRIPNSFCIFANGNNLMVGADAVRRCIQCALDAGMEAPWERHFSGNPVSQILAERGRYVAACLIIARAYLAAGRPSRLPPQASYEQWSDLVRSPLVWLNWPDPLESLATIQAEDPKRQQRAAVFTAWAIELQLEISYQTGELITLASEQDQFGSHRRSALWDALFALAAPRSGFQAIDPRRLGTWLRDNIDTIASGYRLSVDRSDAARPRWKVSLA